jgi:hypothetical protein
MRRVWMIALLWSGLTGRPAGAQLQPPRREVNPGAGRSSALASQAASAVMAGHPEQGLTMADQALSVEPRNPWAHYDRAAALHGLGRTDEAVAEFQLAQQSFSGADPWGRSLAMYGRANVLAQAGRCGPAAAAFEEYAAFVQAADPESAAMARTYAKGCVPRAP